MDLILLSSYHDSFSEKKNLRKREENACVASVGVIYVISIIG